MIVVFYDKNFVALQNNASLNVGSYEIKRRAIDFDEFAVTSEAFVVDVNPCFVVLKDDYGRYKYASFAGIPTKNEENKTILQGSDLKTLFNNDLLISLGEYSYLHQYFVEVFNAFSTQVIQNSFTIDYVLTDILDILISDLKPEPSLKVYNVWDELIIPYLKYYDCYMSSYLDISNKKIIFSIKKSNKYHIPLKLWEHGIDNYGKWVVSINDCQGIVSINGTLSNGYQYILLSNNAITTDLLNRDLFPIKRKVIFKESDDSTKLTELLNEVNLEALTTLVNARYNESIIINTSNIKRFEDADFDTTFDIYTKRGVFYKSLPLGEKEENSNGKNTIKIGYKPDDIVFFL